MNTGKTKSKRVITSHTEESKDLTKKQHNTHPDITTIRASMSRAQYNVKIQAGDKEPTEICFHCEAVAEEFGVEKQLANSNDRFDTSPHN